MAKDYHGIIYAYETSPGLGALVSRRTSASMPFAGRYRLIDFSLSSMVNAGIRDVGVIMQRDYQSLLDHLGSGKDWDMSRRSGGLKLLPPFGLSDSHFGEYKGSMEALSALRSYIKDIKEGTIVLARGDVAANIDLGKAIAQHERSGAQITAVCSKTPLRERHHRFVPDGDTWMNREILCSCTVEENQAGFVSLEVYIIEKEQLLELITRCVTSALLHFHRDALTWYFQNGGAMGIYLHEGYVRQITTVKDYYEASMEIFDADVRVSLFPSERPIRTKERAEASTYYGETAQVKNCLLADGCYIEGELENCVVFRGVRIEKGAKLKNCIIMQDSIIRRDAKLAYIVSDKDAVVTENREMSGSPTLQMVIPKGSEV